MRAGLPHSEIRGSTGARPSPRLFAACYVLHRLSVPRHPPNALTLRLILSLIPSHAETNAGFQLSAIGCQLATLAPAREPDHGSTQHFFFRPARTRTTDSSRHRPPSKDPARKARHRPTRSPLPAHGPAQASRIIDPQCQRPDVRDQGSDVRSHTLTNLAYRSEHAGASLNPRYLIPVLQVVELTWIEPATSCLQSTRSPS